MKLRRAVLAAFAATALGACGNASAATIGRATAVPVSERQEHICQENTLRGEPSASGDCSRIPIAALFSAPEEDDVYGRWDCRVMGNRQCADTLFFTMADGSLVGYHINDPTRPGCFVEPSNTPEGFEVIYRPNIYRPNISVGDGLGFEVRCP